MVELTEANGKPVFVNGDFVPNWEKFKAIRDNIWSNKELGLIKANWKKMDDTELSVLIGRPKSATTLRRCKLKLYRTRKVNKNSMKHWTELEIKTLKIEWKKKSDKELADKLRRSAKSIKLKRLELGLYRSEKRNGRE